MQTAEALHLVAVVEPRLRDCDYGRWSGLRFADLQAREPDAIGAWMAEPGLAPHGGESVLDLLQRVGRWLAERSCERGHAIVVTHPAIIRAAITKRAGSFGPKPPFETASTGEEYYPALPSEPVVIASFARVLGDRKTEPRTKFCGSAVWVDQRRYGNLAPMDRRLDHDIAEILFDTDVAFEDALDDRLIVGNGTRDKLQQVIVTAADKMAFEHFWYCRDASLEFREILRAVVAKGDLGKDNDRLPQLVQRDLGTVAGDETGGFEAFDALQAWALRQADDIGQRRVGHATVFLQGS
jgi:hypothetical protein